MKPITKLGYGQCTFCCSNIHILEQEVLDITLDGEGLPQDFKTESFSAVGYCPNCHKLYDVKKDNLGYSLSTKHFELMDQNSKGVNKVIGGDGKNQIGFF